MTTVKCPADIHLVLLNVEIIQQVTALSKYIGTCAFLQLFHSAQNSNILIL